MKQKRLPKYFNISKSFTLIIVALTFFYISGCALGATYLVEKEEKYFSSYKYNCEYWKIKEVVSAEKRANGDIFICVRLLDHVESVIDDRLVTITLPASEPNAEIATEEKLETSAEACPINDALYRIEKIKDGCEKTNLYSSSSVPIVRLEIHTKDITESYNFNKYPNQLHDLIDTNNRDTQNTEKVYEINVITDDKTNDRKGESNNPILVVYWPSQTLQQGESPIIIEGAYLEDDSSRDPYIARFIPAMIIDFIPYAIFSGLFLLF